MKIKQYFWEKSVLKKVIFGFLFTAIPLYLLTFLMIWNVSDKISKETSKTMKEKLYFFTGYMEDELANVNQMLVALNLDEELDNFYESKKNRLYYECFLNFNSLMDKLKGVYLSSDYINDVFIIFPETGEEISVNHGYRDVPDRQYIRDYRNKDGQIRQLNSYVSNDFIVYFIENYDHYILGVEIFQKKVTESVKKYQLNYKFNVFLVDAKTDKLIGGDALTELDKEIYNGINIKKNDNIAYVDNDKYILQTLLSKDKSFIIVTYILEREILSTYYSFLDFTLVFIIISLLVFFIIAFLINKQVRKPLNLLVEHMRKIEQGDYNLNVNYNKGDEFGFVYKQFNHMMGKLNTLTGEIVEKERQIQKGELKQLQSHINPHFLFNCLYIGYRMAKSGDNENVAMLCKYLGDYFRFVTYFSHKEVKLKDELDYTMTYLKIQKFRYPNKLDFMVNVNVNQETVTVPSLIIQPIVENSIKHGIEKTNNPGLITISVNKVNDELTIDITDNGPGMDEDDIELLSQKLDETVYDEDHYGLWNIYWRLKYLYGDKKCLTINNVESGGFNVSYRLPFKEIKDRGDNIDVQTVNS